MWIAFHVNNGLVQSDCPWTGSTCLGRMASPSAAGATKTASR
jgi:hypothetical protein